MAQTSYTPIQLYYSTTAAAVPVNTNLASGELAINITDGKLYYKNNAGTVTLLSSAAGASGDVVGPSSATANSIALFNSTTGKLIKDSSASDGLIYGLTVGRGAGAVSTNTAVGVSALAGANSGSGSNTSVGYQSLQTNTTGNNNTAVGFNAGNKNLDGNRNVFLGFWAGFNNTSGTGNAFAGGYAGYLNTSGVSNTAFGDRAYATDTTLATGSYNTALGAQALYSNTTASNNTAVGYQAGYTLSAVANQTFLGYQAGYSRSTGADNYSTVMIGNLAGYSTTTGIDNTYMGGYAARYQTGSSNTALGGGALYGASGTSTGSNNTAVGYGSLLSNTTASNNTAVGYQAGYTNQTGTKNVYIGTKAGNVATGSNNTIVGEEAGLALSTGTGNTFVGAYNPSLGGSGEAITSGSKNTIIGAYTGYTAGGLDIRTSSNYIVLSDGDGNPRFYTDGNDFYFKPSATGTIYNTGIYANTTGTGANVVVNSNGSLVRSTSSLKYKRDVQNTTHGLAEVLFLRPVTYKSKSENDGETVFGGLIAEEVHAAGLTEFVQYAEDGTPDALAYSNMVSLCIKAIQELKAEVDSLKSQLNGA